MRKVESRARTVVNLLFGAYNGDITALRRYVFYLIAYFHVGLVLKDEVLLTI